MTKSILILYAHPGHDQSIANRAMRTPAAEGGATTFVDLYADYPTFHIDVPREQERLNGHDIVIFQHPIFWYSAPAIVKEWQDLVLEYGYAYGTGGTALKGKVFLNVLTSAATSEAYTREGMNKYSIRELFRPFELTANLCGMIYLPPFVLYQARAAAQTNDLSTHIGHYAALLGALRRNEIDYDAARNASVLNDAIARQLRTEARV